MEAVQIQKVSPMRHVYMNDEKERIEFAERAAKHFAANPKHWSFTDEDIAPGVLLALRWGLGNDCVAVLKLDSEFTPVIYGNLIGAFQT